VQPAVNIGLPCFQLFLEDMLHKSTKRELFFRRHFLPLHFPLSLHGVPSWAKAITCRIGILSASVGPLANGEYATDPAPDRQGSAKWIDGRHMQNQTSLAPAAPSGLFKKRQRVEFELSRG
jgi:hypothetical protein